MNRRSDKVGSSHLHPLQIIIIKTLTYKRYATFGDIRPNNVTTDLFNYHLQHLVNKKYLKISHREGKKYYCLSDKGNKLTDRIDLPSTDLINQGFSVVILCIWKASSPKTYLIHERTKAPFRGYNGFIAGKVKEQETLQETANRTLAEKTDLKGKCEFKQIIHYIDYTKDHKFLRDIYYHVFEVKNPKGVLKENLKGYNIFWAQKRKIKELKLYPNFWDDFFIWNSSTPILVERVREI